MKRVLIVAILVTSSVVAHAQTLSVSELSERVDLLAKQALARPVAGISIAVAHNGRIVFARGYGLANIEHSVGVTPDTVFHIASVSKNISGLGTC